MKPKPLSLLLCAFCLVGAALQFWSQATAYDAQRLPIPGSLSLMALRVFIIAVPAVALGAALPLRGRRPEQSQGLYAGMDSGERLLGTVAGALIILGGLVQLWGNGQVYWKLRQWLQLGVCAVDVLLICAGVAMIWLSRSGIAEGRQVNHSVAALIPGFAGCFWLVIYYHSHSRDPVVSHYCWVLLCLMASILACYYQAGYAFDRARPSRALFFSSVAAVYAFTALPDGEDTSDALMLLGMGVWMLLHVVLIRRHADKQPADPTLEA